MVAGQASSGHLSYSNVGPPLNRRGFVFVCVHADCLLCRFPGGGRAAGVVGVGEEQLPHGAEQGEYSHTCTLLHPINLEGGKLFFNGHAV